MSSRASSHSQRSVEPKPKIARTSLWLTDSIMVEKGQTYPADHPAVLAHPELFVEA